MNFLKNCFCLLLDLTLSIPIFLCAKSDMKMWGVKTFLGCKTDCRNLHKRVHVWCFSLAKDSGVIQDYSRSSASSSHAWSHKLSGANSQMDTLSLPILCLRLLWNSLSVERNSADSCGGRAELLFFCVFSIKFHLPAALNQLWIPENRLQTELQLMSFVFCFFSAVSVNFFFWGGGHKGISYCSGFLYEAAEWSI